MGKRKSVLTFLLLLIFTLPVQAGGSSISLDPIQAEMKLPPDWTQQEAEEGLLLRAEGPQGLQMSVASQSGEVSQGQWNLALYEESECEKLGESLVESLEKGGYEDVSCELYKNTPLYWLRMVWKKTAEDGAVLSAVQYYTAVNGQSLTVAFTKESTQIADTEAEQMKEIIDSIQFAQILDKPAQEDKSWTNRLIWVALLAAAGLFTYMVTKKRGKR